MLWEEDKKAPDYVVPEDVVDICYKLDCKMIPTTHAWELREALYEALPWLEQEAQTAIHQVHGATSGNGWERPPDGELIHLSRRSRMHLRVPNHRIEDAKALAGQTLDIAGHSLTVGDSTVRTLSALPNIFARYVIMPDKDMDENEFVRWAADEIQKQNVNVRKMLCGISHVISTPEGDLHTRSVMVADLDKPESVKLQETGLGDGQHLGCGIFLPHKGIKAVGEGEDHSHFSGT